MNTTQNREIVVVSDLAQLALEATHRFVQIAKEVIAEKGKFVVALSGGTTPIAMNKLLSSTFKDQVEWDKVYIFWGDERFVPATDPDSSYLAAHESLLKNVPIPESQIFRFPTELSSPEETVSAYAKTLVDVIGGPVPEFDLILLGMGPDGHTASLFPGFETVKSQNLTEAVYDAPKPPPTRLTVTPVVINNADRVMFLVTGADKSPMVGRVLNASNTVREVPAEYIKPTHGKLIWLVDEKAAAEIKRS